MLTPDQINDLRIARWLERIVAFIVDSAVMGIAGIIVVGAVFGFTLESYESNDEFSEIMDEYGPLNFAMSGILFFAYLVLMEHYTGTTIGRRIFNLQVVDIEGGRPSIKAILIHNAGKSYLLVLDIILGLIFARQYRQRISAKLGGILVIKTSANDDIDTRYEFD